MKGFGVGNRHASAGPRVFWTTLAVLALAGATTPAFAQCTFANGFFSATINSAGAPVTISTCSFAGEYSTINGAVSGQTLRFTSSVATDFITIHTGTPSGPVIVFGGSPLTFVNTHTGTLYAHWATNAACGTQSNCRTTRVQCTNCNDACAAGIVIDSPSTTVGSTLGATSDAVPSCGTTLNAAPGIWYRFTPCETASFTASLCGSAYDTKIGVFTGTCAAPVCVTGNDDFCGLQSEVGFTGNAGTTYLILVTGFGIGAGNFTLNMAGAGGCGVLIFRDGFGTGTTHAWSAAAP